jgi:hypothetical protein
MSLKEVASQQVISFLYNYFYRGTIFEKMKIK